MAAKVGNFGLPGKPKRCKGETEVKGHLYTDPPQLSGRTKLGRRMFNEYGKDAPSDDRRFGGPLMAMPTRY